MPVSLAFSPWPICVALGVSQMAWPPSWVMPVSKELRVRVDSSKNSMYSVLARRMWSCKTPVAKSPFSLNARSSIVFRSSTVQSGVQMKSF